MHLMYAHLNWISFPVYKAWADFCWQMIQINSSLRCNCPTVCVNGKADMSALSSIVPFRMLQRWLFVIIFNALKMKANDDDIYEAFWSQVLWKKSKLGIKPIKPWQLELVSRLKGTDVNQSLCIWCWWCIYYPIIKLIITVHTRV